MDENKVNDVSTEEQAQVEAEVLEETAAEVETESTGAQEEVVIEEKQKTGFVGFIKNCFSRKNIKKTIAVILLVLIAGGAAGAYFHSRTPEAVAIKFAKADFENDVIALSDLYAYDYRISREGTIDDWIEGYNFYSFISSLYGEEIDDWNEYCGRAHTRALEELYDKYGDYTISCEVVKSKDLVENKIEELRAEVEKNGLNYPRLDSNDISEAKQLTVKLKFECEDEDSFIVRYKLTLVKVSNNWRVLESSGAEK